MYPANKDVAFPIAVTGDDESEYIVDLLQDRAMEAPFIKFSFSLLKKIRDNVYEFVYSTPYFSYTSAEDATSFVKAMNVSSVIS